MAKINIKLDKAFINELIGTLDKSKLGNNRKLLGLFDMINVYNKDSSINTKEITDFANSIFEVDANGDEEIDSNELETYVKNNEDKFKQFRIKAKDILEFFNIFKTAADKSAEKENEYAEKRISELLEGRNISESERIEIINLSKQYDIEYIEKILSMSISNVGNHGEDNNSVRGLTPLEIIKFFNLPSDKQQKVIDFIESGKANKNGYKIVEIIELLSVEDIMGIDVLNYDKKISYSYLGNTSPQMISVKDEDHPGIQKIYNPEYKDGVYEQIINDAENKSITIINYKNHIKQTAHYTIPALSAAERIGYKSNPEKFRIYNNETIEFFDDNGQTYKTIVREDSEVYGVQNITIITQDNVEHICQAYVDNEGNTIISKNFESPLGDRTNYDYKRSKDGDITECNYRVTDTNGGTIYERNQKISLISDNKYLHNINDKSYIVTFDDGSVTINRLEDGETVTIDLKNLIAEEGYDNVMEVLRTMPADRLWVMKKMPLNEIHYDLDGSEAFRGNNGAYIDEQRAIIVGKQYAQDHEQDAILAILLHEFGHYIDSDVQTGATGIIGYDEEVINIFNQEYAEFMKNSTTLQQQHIAYFSTNNRAMTERVAEANLLLTANQSSTKSSRALYYQQYFPRTIACIAKKIDQRLEEFQT